MSNRFPREIEPESVDQGDKVRVEFRSVDGVQRQAIATVHRRVDEGPSRTLYTFEGGHIVTWYRGDRSGITVYLLSRPEHEQTPLPIFEHIAERIA